MTIFHFQTHVSDSGVITLPPHAENLYGKDVVLNIGLSSEPKPERSFEELCGVWGNEEDREDIDRVAAATHDNDGRPNPVEVRRFFDSRQPFAVDVTDDEIEKLKHERRMRKMQ